MNANEIRGMVGVEKVYKFIQSRDKPMKIGKLYEEYFDSLGKYLFSYKTFQRYIEELAAREKIFIKKINGGEYGNTTVISKRLITNENIKRLK